MVSAFYSCCCAISKKKLYRIMKLDETEKFVALVENFEQAGKQLATNSVAFLSG